MKDGYYFAKGMRELLKAEALAQRTYDILGMRNTSGLDEDERAALDLEYLMAREELINCQSDVYSERSKRNLARVNKPGDWKTDLL